MVTPKLANDPSLVIRLQKQKEGEALVQKTWESWTLLPRAGCTQANPNGLKSTWQQACYCGRGVVKPTPHPERSKSSSWNRLTAWARAPGALCQASARLRRGANKLRGNVRCSTAASAAAPWKTHPSQSCTRSDANG
eukprot:1161325-Pelagomonas_calceolata.AAC.15